MVTMRRSLNLLFLLCVLGFCQTQYHYQNQDYVDPGPGYDPAPGYGQGGSHGYGQGGSNGFCGFLGKLLMCQCSEDAAVICEEGLIPYGYCPMHPMMPMMRTQCCPRTYVMMCSQQNNPYETQQGSYFLMMQSAANPEL